MAALDPPAASPASPAIFATLLVNPNGHHAGGVAVADPPAAGPAIAPGKAPPMVTPAPTPPPPTHWRAEAQISEAEITTATADEAKATAEITAALTAGLPAGWAIRAVKLRRVWMVGDFCLALRQAGAAVRSYARIVEVVRQGALVKAVRFNDGVERPLDVADPRPVT